MNKYLVIVKSEDGSYREVEIIASNRSELKELKGFVTVMKGSRVRHPSPEMLVEALNFFNIDLAEFYTFCNNNKQIDNELNDNSLVDLSNEKVN